MSITRVSQPIVQLPATVAARAPTTVQPNTQVASQEQLAQQQKVRTCGEILIDNSGKIAIGAALASLLSAAAVQKYVFSATPAETVSNNELTPPPAAAAATLVPCNWTEDRWCALTSAAAPALAFGSELITTTTTLGVAGIDSVRNLDTAPITQAWETADKTQLYTLGGFFGLTVAGLTIYLAKRCRKTRANAAGSTAGSAAAKSAAPTPPPPAAPTPAAPTPPPTTSANASDSDKSPSGSASGSPASSASSSRPTPTAILFQSSSSTGFVPHDSARQARQPAHRVLVDYDSTVAANAPVAQNQDVTSFRSIAQAYAAMPREMPAYCRSLLKDLGVVINRTQEQEFTYQALIIFSKVEAAVNKKFEKARDAVDYVNEIPYLSLGIAQVIVEDFQSMISDNPDKRTKSQKKFLRAVEDYIRQKEADLTGLTDLYEQQAAFPVAADSAPHSLPAAHASPSHLSGPFYLHSSVIAGEAGLRAGSPLSFAPGPYAIGVGDAAATPPSRRFSSHHDAYSAVSSPAEAQNFVARLTGNLSRSAALVTLRAAAANHTISPGGEYVLAALDTPAALPVNSAVDADGAEATDTAVFDAGSDHDEEAVLHVEGDSGFSGVAVALHSPASVPPRATSPLLQLSADSGHDAEGEAQ